MANTTASHNRAGQYIRSRRKPVTPMRTPAQAQARTRFKSVSSSWGGLTDSQRAAWTAMAATHPVTDSLGQTVVLTGSQFYNGVNASLLNAGQPTISDPPTNEIVGSPTGSKVLALSTGKVFVSADAPTAGDFVLAALSKPVSAGVTFNRNQQQFAVLKSSSNCVDVSAPYGVYAGTLPSGKKIFLRVKYVNSGGLSGSYIFTTTIVRAATTTSVGVVGSPTAGELDLSTSDSSAFNYYIFDSTGKQVNQGASSGASPVAVVGLTSGATYTVYFASGSTSATPSLITAETAAAWQQMTATVS